MNGEGVSSGGIGNKTGWVYSSSVEGNVTDSRHVTIASSTDPRYPIHRVPSYDYSSGAMQQQRVIYYYFLKRSLERTMNIILFVYGVLDYGRGLTAERIYLHSRYC